MKRGSSLSRGSGAQLSDSFDIACIYTTQPQRGRRGERRNEEGGREGGREEGREGGGCKVTDAKSRVGGVIPDLL